MDGSIIDFDKTGAIETEEEQLLEEYEQLSIKLHKQQLILSVMKDIESNDIKGVDEQGKKNIDEALNFVRAYEYMKMDETGARVLGLPDKPRELSYVEKRALKSTVLETLPKYYEKGLQFCREMEPEVLNPTILDDQLLDLKAREKELLTELAAKKVELCDALSDCIEMRHGPDVEQASQLDKSRIRFQQVKAQLIKTLAEDNINNMSSHLAEALARVELSLDDAIVAKKVESSEKSK